MIAGIFHKGSGLGNQLHRYVATRVLALDKGYDFSMVAPENFKGSSFMNLDMGGSVRWTSIKTEYPSGKVVPEYDNFGVQLAGSDRWQLLNPWEEKTPYYNPEFNFIKDNTIIDGEFQDERYFEHRLDEIDMWLCNYGNHKSYTSYTDNESICIIGFRGGEFYTVPELGLPKSYYDKAIEIMRTKYKIKRFQVHTDDVVLAKQFFPDFEVIHDVAENWLHVRYFRYAIIANSSFYILPRLLKHNHKYPKDYNRGKNLSVTIAPHYWDRYNIKKWERPYNYYKAFTYIHA